MIRKPAVADQFYPGDARQLAATIKALTPPVLATEQTAALAVVAPHAGYIYSGQTAAETFARVQVPANIVILGPNHHGLGAPLAIMSEGSWSLPLGAVPINTTLSELIKRHVPLAREDSSAHRHEHSLEVQLPFLQTARANISLSPLVVSQPSYPLCREIGQGLARAIKEFGRPVLMVASTDMTHYQPRAVANRQDHLALARITALDPKGLYHTVLTHGITMCGFIPTTITLLAALELGATKAELISYSDSGAASGDTDRVVGYAGLIIS
ncbi:MAG: AmmeMemoRadiSam system protein B [Desulfobulbaceae bacterium]|nr:AmmeMemoRadiSam system protein B [Desulfobulbaceae bacterium]